MNAIVIQLSGFELSSYYGAEKGFVIARPTEEEAKAEFDRLMALQKQEEHYRLNLAKGIDPEAVMFQIFAKNPAVGGNGGTAAGLVGS